MMVVLKAVKKGNLRWDGKKVDQMVVKKDCWMVVGLVVMMGTKRVVMKV